MNPNRYRYVLGAVLFVLWIALAWLPSWQELVVGALVAAGLALAPLPGRHVYGEFPLTVKKIATAVAYLFVFIGAVVRSNLDVAFRVLSPRLPINPGIVRVKTRLQSRLGRLLLANSITLTPGTISVAIHGDDIFVHWINVASEDVEASTRKIVSDFERYLEVCFG
jgi:multicomponent Na+:H+ antiporter subunit E